jgi:hypothetical protein
MTDLLTSDHADSGEIPAFDPLGTEATRDLREHRRDTTGEKTQNIKPYADGLRPPLRSANVYNLEDTVIYREPLTIGVVDPAGPQKPVPAPQPNPGPPPKPSAAWERVIDTQGRLLLGATADVDGDLRPAVPPKPAPKPTPPKPSKRSVRYTIPADARPWTAPRHAKPAPAWTKWAIGVGALMVLWAVVTLAVIR